MLLSHLFVYLATGDYIKNDIPFKYTANLGQESLFCMVNFNIAQIQESFIFG